MWLSEEDPHYYVLMWQGVVILSAHMVGEPVIVDTLDRLIGPLL